MKKYTVELTKEQLKQLGIKIKFEFTYPLFKRWKSDGEIIKFTSMTEGVIVWKGCDYRKVGQISTDFTKHTNDYWEDVVYDSERDLWDKQPCECWDNNTCQRLIRFYDAKNKCTFTNDGRRDGPVYDNYKPISSDRYDEWILEAYKTLEK